MLIRLNFFIQAMHKNGKNELVLSFDDGPHPIHTIRILDILDENKVKAVFFMIGEHVNAHPEVAKEVATRGHQIGIHSQSHLNYFGFLKGKKLRFEMEECARSIEKATGLKTHLFRPPFGTSTPAIAREVKYQKYDTIGWNVRSLDSLSKNPDKIAKRVLQKVEEDSIILLHDSLEQTCKALPKILEGINGMGIAIGELSMDSKA
jgi:peptidoglycan/xylan/chitin deacetylase (PgdA/CDA1 family)